MAQRERQRVETKACASVWTLVQHYSFTADRTDPQMVAALRAMQDEIGVGVGPLTAIASIPGSAR